MISNRKRLSRRGSLLAQQLILIGISGVLMMLAIKLIHQTLDFASIYQGRFNDQRTMSLLSRTFRSDLHTARSVNLSDANHLELTTLAGTRIVYRIEKSKITREFWSDGNQTNGSEKPHATDSYRLSENQSAVLSVDTELATLIVETNDGNDANLKSLPHKRLMIRAGSVSAPGSSQGGKTKEGASDEQ
ncbi:MAG: hypothetical protein ACK5YR_23960 [Pirellula sp.]|jgi:hypothetical protein